MSQPRRRRRRGRRGGQQGGGGPSKNEAIRESVDGTPKSGERSGRSSRRRGKGRSGRTSSPKSSEDLVRALPKERPETLTAPPDGQTLEAVIGDLQSTWGVPAYPQEYRITIKVAEEREARGDQSNGDSGKDDARASTDQKRERADGGRGDQPRREKAPAAPGMRSGGGREKTAGNRKRRRRRRRGGGGGNADGSSGGSNNGGNGGS